MPDASSSALAEFGATNGYKSLLRLFDEHEEVLREFVYTSTSDEEIVRRTRFWQLFKHFTNLLREPERLSASLKNEIEQFMAETANRDPLAPRTQDFYGR